MTNQYSRLFSLIEDKLASPSKSERSSKSISSNKNSLLVEIHVPETQRTTGYQRERQRTGSQRNAPMADAERRRFGLVCLQASSDITYDRPSHRAPPFPENLCTVIDSQSPSTHPSPPPPTSLRHSVRCTFTYPSSPLPSSLIYQDLKCRPNVDISFEISRNCLEASVQGRTRRGVMRTPCSKIASPVCLRSIQKYFPIKILGLTMNFTG